MYLVVLSLDRVLMSLCIEQADGTLAEQRGKGLLLDKGYRATNLTTVIGVVIYRRHVYLVVGDAAAP